MIQRDMDFLRLKSRSTKEAMGIHDTTRHGVSQIEVEVDRRSDGGHDTARHDVSLIEERRYW